MTILTFKYIKEPGNESDRVFVPLVSPTEKYFGIDISELDMEDQVAFAMEAEKIVDEQKAKIDSLMVKYDVKYKYRFFLPEKMENIVTE